MLVWLRCIQCPDSIWAEKSRDPRLFSFSPKRRGCGCILCATPYPAWQWPSMRLTFWVEGIPSYTIIRYCCCSGVHIPSFSRLILKHPQNWKLALSENQYFVRVDQFGLGLKSLFREHVYFSGWFCVFRFLCPFWTLPGPLKLLPSSRSKSLGQQLLNRVLPLFLNKKQPRLHN